MNCAYDHTPTGNKHKCYVCQLGIPRVMRPACPYKRLDKKVKALVCELNEVRQRLAKIQTTMVRRCLDKKCRSNTHKVNDSFCATCHLMYYA